MPQVLDYSRPAPSDGPVPLIAMIGGLVSGPVGIVTCYLLHQLDFVWPVIDLLLLVGVPAVAVALSLLAGARFAHNPHNRRLVAIATTAAAIWFAIFALNAKGFCLHQPQTSVFCASSRALHPEAQAVA